MKQKNKISFLSGTSKLMILTVIYELFVYLLSASVKNYFYILVPLLIAYIFGTILLCNKSKDSKNIIFYLVFVFGVILRTIYIFETNIYVRQHDVLDIGECGHLDYIYTIYMMHRLPKTINWQFYHPPLWHILSALWLVFLKLFGFELSYLFEGIQILSLLFSSFMVVIANQICLKLKLNDKYRFLVDALVAINPTLIMFSGSINNDCLLTFLEALVMLELFNWHDHTDTKNTIKLAIVTGLCVMTKLNGAIMALPIIYVFVRKFRDVFIKNKEEIKGYISKILLFGLISLPIGLWYQVRSIIKFSNMMVPTPGDWLYTGNHSFASRFLSLNMHQLFNYANMDMDYNLPSFLIRSAIFGEYHFNIPKFLFLSLIILLCILVAFFVIGSIKYLFEKKNVYVNVLLITWYISIVSSIIFYYNYPYACSMDYRYISICLLCSSVFIGYMLNKLTNKYLRILFLVIILLYILCNIIFVLQI